MKNVSRRDFGVAVGAALAAPTQAQGFRRENGGNYLGEPRVNGSWYYDAQSYVALLPSNQILVGGYDAMGLLADRANYDAESVGFTYLATDTRLLKYYVREGIEGTWTEPSVVVLSHADCDGVMAGDLFRRLWARTTVVFDNVALAAAASIPATVRRVQITGRADAVFTRWVAPMNTLASTLVNLAWFDDAGGNAGC